ncbi:uncharacterized protein LOC129788985 [Lutzomyia longipalpis]|uniref:uncharacterized protein LOC129788985 n=1 Tax=Lutzomyia longipalpis TaxID=7200 RepID=UPI002483C6C0|nr:uncharacterized protein LOC129788985 [Lutzomyia longipalpis]XP_055681532.1 uncharacterized protein LOC129788985 [Lutzomyia longipalpis]XP_055681533.1 uncharacterized protein LOC129788985 [Lutzomyia longipalpis]XP_055681535.1 uncharacterized protein LOC129788985 [Lutzomyia longipalpis]
MRCNSGFLRWPPLLVIIGSCLYLLLTFNTVNSSPLHQRLVRMIRDQENEQIIDHRNTTNDYQYVTKESAEKCLFDGALVPKSQATCESKPGCRVIQKTGECCPDFQCQCERDGKIYAIGEKLVDPETPCRVCYCQGGEFICNNVTCYNRNDCEPKFIAGRCCPEYDNCPPLEHVKVGPTEMMFATEATDPVTPHSESLPETTSTVRSTILYPLPNGNNNQLGIKIKEITKVEEIRITNPPKNEPLPTAKTPISVDTTAEAPRSTTQNPVASTEGSSEVNKLEDLDVHEEESTRDTFKSVRQTVTEEILLDKSSEDGNFTEISTTDEELVSFSSTPPADPQLYPSVVQMGDRVVIVDHNGKTKPITILGAEGLQLGGEELDHIEVSSAPTSLSTNEIISPSSGDDATNDIFGVDTSSGTTELPGNEQERYEEDHEGESSNLYLIASTPLVESSGENLLVLVNGTFNDEESDMIYDTVLYTQAPPDGGNSNETETFDTTYFRDEESTENDTTENWLNARGFSATSEEDTLSTSPATAVDTVIHQRGEDGNLRPETYIEEDELANHELINPEYPPLPEDVSLYGREHGSAPFADDEMEQSRTHHDHAEKLPEASTEKLIQGVEQSENETVDASTPKATEEPHRDPAESSESSREVLIVEGEISSPESLMMPPHNPKDDAESLKYKQQEPPVETSLQVEDNRSSPDAIAPLSAPYRTMTYL